MFVLPLLFASLHMDVYGNNYQSNLTDLTLPSEPHGKPAEAVVEECSSTKKYLYRNQCWDLLSRGPCNEGQWLVLKRPDYEGAPAVTCAKRKCSDRDAYWPSDGFCYDAETARRRRLCPRPNTELVIDDFGEGRCGCRKGDKVPYVKVMPSGSDGEGEENSSAPCYPLFARGPCPERHVLTPAGSGYGKCTMNKCTAKHHRVEPTRPLQLGLRRSRRQLQQNLQHQQQLEQSQNEQQLLNVQWTDGLCYELGTRGPCSDNEQFIILQDTMRPGCTNSVIGLHLTKGGCLKNHLGGCQDQIEFQTNGSSIQNLEPGIIDLFYRKHKKKTTNLISRY